MSFIYILVRTFPFWAIPAGITLIAAAWGNRHKQSGKEKALYYGMAAVLLLASVAFFALKGPSRAVPFVHAILNEQAFR